MKLWFCVMASVALVSCSKNENEVCNDQSAISRAGVYGGHKVVIVCPGSPAGGEIQSSVRDKGADLGPIDVLGMQ